MSVIIHLDKSIGTLAAPLLTFSVNIENENWVNL